LVHLIHSFRLPAILLHFLTKIQHPIPMSLA
jgi:hypothetical protein